ncbi:MAG: hypothetical protein NT154_05515 [Verrucomicrobia bacterium]|nr:hypothetical protein [Verrucomicrobiota bacterium]
MKNRRAIWGICAVIGVITICLMAPPFAPRHKAKPQGIRIANVNRVSSVTLVLNGTNALPASKQAPKQ